MENYFKSTPCLNQLLEGIINGTEGPKIKMTTRTLNEKAHITWHVYDKIIKKNKPPPCLSSSPSSATSSPKNPNAAPA